MNTGNKTKSASFLSMVVSSRQMHENEKKFYRPLDGIDSPGSVDSMQFTCSRRCSTVEGGVKIRNEISQYLTNHFNGNVNDIVDKEKEDESHFTALVNREIEQKDQKVNQEKKWKLNQEKEQKVNQGKEREINQETEHKIERKVSGSDDEYELVFDDA